MAKRVTANAAGKTVAQIVSLMVVGLSDEQLALLHAASASLG